MKQYVITEELVLSLLDYLQRRPYIEVHGGIKSLLELPELPLKEEK